MASLKVCGARAHPEDPGRGWVVGGTHGAAVRLGMKRSTLYSRMGKLGISRAASCHDEDTEILWILKG